MEKSLPEAFCTRIGHQFPDQAPELLALLDQPAPVSIRLNPFFKTRPLMEAVEWEPDACYVSHPVKFGTDPLFHGGAYYVQEASSMAIGWMVRHLLPRFASRPLKVLDACAAPGGKTTHLLATLPPDALVVANEYVQSRYPALCENLIKWGYPNQIITRTSLSAYRPLGPVFDLVVADVPCSGEGMFRKNPEARDEWTPVLSQSCGIRQQEILQDLIPLLRPGGFLIFSTCTFAPKENEFGMKWLIGQHLDCQTPHTPPGKNWRRIETDNGAFGWLALPGIVRGEGFFCSVFQKQPDGSADSPIHTERSGKAAKIAAPFILPAGIQFLPGHDGSLYVVTQETAQFQHLLNQAGVRTRCGLNAGLWKSNKFIPNAELAFWKGMPEGLFPILETDRGDAVRFLRKENMETNPVGKGIHLVTHREIGLGWVNLIPGRQNNLYPPAWRIRDTSDPALDPLPQQ